MEDPRLADAPVVADLALALAEVAAGLYVGGSVAARDYRPGVSDIDAVALLSAPPSPATRLDLTAVHTRLAAQHDHGDLLHCVYVPEPQVGEVDRRHWTWAFGELFRRPFSRIARADLLTDPVVVRGPHPSAWLPPVSAAELGDAARAELAGYWTRALRKRAIWTQDVYVDLGLTVWVRAETAITDGVLLTKSEAIARLRHRGLPSELVEGVESRRAGKLVEMTEEQRAERGTYVRDLLRRELPRLLARP